MLNVCSDIILIEINQTIVYLMFACLQFPLRQIELNFRDF